MSPIESKMELVVHSFDPNPYGAHVRLVNLVGKNKRVLDVGCANGNLAEQLNKNGCSVVGIEVNLQSAGLAKSYCDNVIVADLDSLYEIEYDDDYFDAILFSNVLEHLKDPIEILISLKRYLKNDGNVYLSIPNVANWSVRLKLLLGRFDYQELGILDRTHLRFYTLKSIKDLLCRAGFEILKIDVSTGTPFPRRTGILGYATSRLLPTLFALQFLIVARNIKVP